jgi:hypothetical protein
MSKKATIFIGLTIAVGTVFVGDSVTRDSSFDNLSVYIWYFALALLTSALKVRLPGIAGTISVNFLFVLISTAVFSFSETVILAGAASLVQSFWKARRRPRFVQVAFNVAALAVSSGIAYRAAHSLADGRENSTLLLLPLAACFYFTSNTLLVSGVLSLIDSKPLLHVWKQCYLWSFPYYLVGAAIAGLIVLCATAMGWAIPLLILPLMFMVHIFYRTYVARVAH